MSYDTYYLVHITQAFKRLLFPFILMGFSIMTPYSSAFLKRRNGGDCDLVSCLFQRQEFKVLNAEHTREYG